MILALVSLVWLFMTHTMTPIHTAKYIVIYASALATFSNRLPAVYRTHLHTEDNTSRNGVTFTDITGDAADLAVHHFLMQVFNVKGLHSEGQCSGQHGKHTHTPGKPHNTSRMNNTREETGL